jgi:hypothetical protein
MNKYLTFFLRDRFFIVHFIVLVSLIVGFFTLGQIQAAQKRSLKKIQQERSLVFKIDEMQDKIRNRLMQQDASNQDIGNKNVNTDVKVEGVMYKGTKPYVIINGTIYEEGAQFGQYKIVKIYLNSLSLFNSETNAEEIVVFSETAQDLIDKGLAK